LFFGIGGLAKIIFLAHRVEPGELRHGFDPVADRDSSQILPHQESETYARDKPANSTAGNQSCFPETPGGHSRWQHSFQTHTPKIEPSNAGGRSRSRQSQNRHAQAAAHGLAT
jgi:hypothetical protein